MSHEIPVDGRPIGERVLEAVRAVGREENLYGFDCIVVPPKWFDMELLGTLREKDRFYQPELLLHNVKSIVVQACYGQPLINICRGYENGSWPKRKSQQP